MKFFKKIFTIMSCMCMLLNFTGVHANEKLNIDEKLILKADTKITFTVPYKDVDYADPEKYETYIVDEDGQAYELILEACYDKTVQFVEAKLSKALNDVKKVDWDNLRIDMYSFTKKNEDGDEIFITWNSAYVDLLLDTPRRTYRPNMYGEIGRVEVELYVSNIERNITVIFEK